MRFVRWAPACLLAIGLSFAPSGTALAEEHPGGISPGGVPDALMLGLAQHAEKVEQMMKRGAFTLDGHMEQVDDKGKVSDTKDITVRSTPTGKDGERTNKVLKYLEDGKDKTSELQAKENERAAKGKDTPKKKARKGGGIAFSASQQDRYIFSLAERDKNDPTHVRINFNPKKPADDTVKGSVWVDETSKEVLSVGFSLSENPTFVDHVEVTIVFGLSTPFGRGPSSMTVDLRGGFLFVHKHYRATARISDPAIAI